MWRSVIRYAEYQTFGGTFYLLSLLHCTWRQQFLRNNSIHLPGPVSRPGWGLVGENVISHHNERRLCNVLGLGAYLKFFSQVILRHRSQWPRSLRLRSAAACLLRMWVRITPGVWTFICFECCMLSGRRLWDELITRPEESYRLWWVVVCNLETSWMRGPWPTGGCRDKNKQNSSPLRCVLVPTHALVNQQTSTE